MPPSDFIILPFEKEERGDSMLMSVSIPSSQVPSSFLNTLLPFLVMYSLPKESELISAMKEGEYGVLEPSLLSR